MGTLPICVGNSCPVCEGKIIPGLDNCFCYTCRVYYPTPTGIEMERERKEKENRGRQKKGDKEKGTLINLSDSFGLFHHDFEDSY